MPITTFQDLHENSSFKFLCDVIFPFYPANLPFFVLKLTIFN